MLRVLEIFLLVFFALLAVVGSILLIQFSQIPDVSNLKSCLTTKMNNVYLCKSSKDYVNLDSISPYLKNAVIVSEDVGFLGHNGFDFSEIKESFKKNLEKGRYARGGSTISQQLAKNVYLTEDKSLARKIREAMITYEIEKKYSKDFILEKYLNVVEFGKQIYGIKLASYHYFNKHPSELTALESAFLAFLLPNPEKYSMNFYKKKLTSFTRDRLNDILFKMKFFNKISEEEYELAISQMDSFFSSESPEETL